MNKTFKKRRLICKLLLFSFMFTLFYGTTNNLVTQAASHYSYSAEQINYLDQRFQQHGWTQRRGSSHNSAELVRAIQTVLNELGYGPLTVDGIYGSGTQNAVRAFQRANSLSADGQTGKQTWNKLVSAYLSVSNTYSGTSNTVSSTNALVTVASREIGYQEGYNNITKYNQWYYGYNASAPWCAIFVSWCSRVANISTNIIPNFASVSVGKQWFESRNQFCYRGSYTPKAGDLIFFNGHVGIVKGCDGASVFTIEGNSSNRVQERTYSLYSSNIIGYGVPAY